MTARIARLTARDFAGAVPALADLFAEVVADGASLGFVDPFGRDAAAAWWSEQGAALVDGRLTVWTAEVGGHVVGTISLARNPKPNGRHRAEIVKLMVRPDARGHGLARALLAEAERAAALEGFRLLLLDTEADSPAEHLYLSAGWTRYGIVPAYAADPAGALKDCAFFYRTLG
ncbi:GNAT family N-acetyltransferase [Streptomyces avicenniae]|uniref:GNAT family N-acetyltransferase n=1 Tax=Streptomyces avicenniae TaxID=500153 RepID=UPI00069BB8C6|nr:GNAT family N-acetyltransferase [Streptomyces avicenniae]